MAKRGRPRKHALPEDERISSSSRRRSVSKDGRRDDDDDHDEDKDDGDGDFSTPQRLPDRRQERVRGAGIHTIQEQRVHFPTPSPSIASSSAASAFVSTRRPMLSTIADRIRQRMSNSSSGLDSTSNRVEPVRRSTASSSAESEETTKDSVDVAERSPRVRANVEHRRRERMRGAGTHAIRQTHVNFPAPSISSQVANSDDNAPMTAHRSAPSDSVSIGASSHVEIPSLKERILQRMRGAGRHQIDERQVDFPTATPSSTARSDYVVGIRRSSDERQREDRQETFHDETTSHVTDETRSPIQTMNERRQQRMRGAGTHAVQTAHVGFRAPTSSVGQTDEASALDDQTQQTDYDHAATMNQRRQERMRGAGTYAVQTAHVGFHAPTSSVGQTDEASALDNQTQQTDYDHAATMNQRRQERMRGAGTHAVQTTHVGFRAPSLSVEQTDDASASGDQMQQTEDYDHAATMHQRRQERMRGAGTHEINAHNVNFPRPSPGNLSPSINTSTRDLTASQQTQQIRRLQRTDFANDTDFGILTRTNAPFSSHNEDSSIDPRLLMDDVPSYGHEEMQDAYGERSEITDNNNDGVAGQQIEADQRHFQDRDRQGVYGTMIGSHSAVTQSHDAEYVPVAIDRATGQEIDAAKGTLMPLTTNVKRVRGRPRKTPVEKSVASYSLEDDGTPTTQGGSVVPVKRGRGRPRKDGTIRPPDANRPPPQPRPRMPFDPPYPSDSEDEQSDEPRFVKKRGRPAVRRSESLERDSILQYASLRRLSKATDPNTVQIPLWFLPPGNRPKAEQDAARKEFKGLMTLAVGYLPKRASKIRINDADVIYTLIKRECAKMARTEQGAEYVDLLDAILGRLLPTFRTLSEQTTERTRLMEQLSEARRKKLKLRKLVFQKRTQALRVQRAVDALRQQQGRRTEKAGHEQVISEFIRDLRRFSVAKLQV